MILIVLFAFLTSFCIIIGLMNLLFFEKLEIKERLDKLDAYQYSTVSGADIELQKPFIERIIKPILSWLSKITQKITPTKHKEVLKRKFTLVGGFFGINLNEFISLYYGFAVIMSCLGYILGVISGKTIVIKIMCAVVGIILGAAFMEVIISTYIRKRQMSITRGLPDVLDLLTVSVEAGLGFDAALQKVIQKTEGAISYEFNKTLQEIKMGKPRKDALRDLANRTGVEDLNTFVGAIIQADQLGVSISNVLRIQSKQMRVIKKQRIEERAMKAPIKMLLPMVFFIFPTIFLVLLGPAFIQLIENMRY